MADNPRIEDLRRRVQKDPASIAFAQLAEEYRRAGQHQEAVDACCAGLVLHPGYLSARVTLGRALIELGDLDRAQRELETVLKSAPENLTAIRGIADIHYKRGALVEALEFYRTALVLAPNDPDLDQTVADLTQRLGPSKRPEPRDGLSFDQMQREMSARVPPPTRAPVDLAQDRPPGKPSDVAYARSAEQLPRKPAPAPPPALQISSSDAAGRTRTAPRVQAAQGVDSPVMTPTVVRASSPGHPRAVRTIAALEQWLDAIHVTRANAAS